MYSNMFNRCASLSGTASDIWFLISSRSFDKPFNYGELYTENSTDNRI